MGRAITCHEVKSLRKGYSKIQNLSMSTQLSFSSLGPRRKLLKSDDPVLQNWNINTTKLFRWTKRDMDTWKDILNLKSINPISTLIIFIPVFAFYILQGARPVCGFMWLMYLTRSFIHNLNMIIPSDLSLNLKVEQDGCGLTHEEKVIKISIISSNDKSNFYS